MTDPIHLNVQLDPLPDRALTVEQAVAATMNALCHALLPAEGQDRVADLAVTADPPAGPGVHWRTGAKLGRTLYQHHGPDDHHGELVGLMDTPELARQVAAAVNAQTPAQPAESHTDGTAAGQSRTASPDGESGTEDLDAIETHWLQQCPVHDCGLPGDCACPEEDHRPTMSALVGKLRRARAVLDAAQRAQTPAQPAESHTDGTAAGQSRTASPDGESGTQPLIAWRGCGMCFASLGEPHSQMHAKAIRADEGPDAVVEYCGYTGDAARWQSTAIELEDWRQWFGKALQRIRRACGYEDPWMHDEAEVGRICEHIAALAEERDQLRARVAELEQQMAETEEAQHDTAGQLRDARRQVETWRKRALDAEAEHDDYCPALCPLCDETLAAAVCQRCHGTGDVGGGAHAQCPECAGLGRVHEGCVEIGYADLVAERGRLRQQLEQQEFDYEIQLANERGSRTCNCADSLDLERRRYHALLRRQSDRPITDHDRGIVRGLDLAVDHLRHPGATNEEDTDGPR